MCWMKNVSQPWSWRSFRYSISRSNVRFDVRTRSTGRISDSIERIGLIFSVEPSHAWAPPTRPPRRRDSRVSTANQTLRSRREGRAAAGASADQTFRFARAGWGARGRLRGAAAGAGDARRGHRQHPEPCARGGGVEDDDPVGVDAALDELVARLLRRGERAGDAGAQVDRDDVAAGLEQRLVDREEVADRRL